MKRFLIVVALISMMFPMTSEAAIKVERHVADDGGRFSLITISDEAEAKAIVIVITSPYNVWFTYVSGPKTFGDIGVFSVWVDQTDIPASFIADAQKVAKNTWVLPNKPVSDQRMFIENVLLPGWVATVFMRTTSRIDQGRFSLIGLTTAYRREMVYVEDSE